ncbi:MAG: hypothetical protein JJ895_10725 [Balneolaceae bacterium]|nr:hypothetical protein [Balneolaceae bacterium]
MNKKYPNRRSIRLQSWNYAWPGYYFITICTKNFEHTFGEVQHGIMKLNSFGEIAQQEWIKTREIRDNVLLDEFVIMPNHMHGIIRIIDKGPSRDSVQAYREGSEIVRAYRDTPVLPNRDMFEFPNRNTPIHPRDKPQLPNRDKPANNDRGKPSYQKSNLPLNDKVVPENPNENNINHQFPKRSFKSPSKNLGAIIRGYKAAVTTRINKSRKVKGMHVWHRNYYEHIIRNEAALHSIRYYIKDNPEKWEMDRFRKL